MMVPRVRGPAGAAVRADPAAPGRAGERGGFVLGLALGAVYVPCAGPVLAAITVAGATGRIGVAHGRAHRSPSRSAPRSRCWSSPWPGGGSPSGCGPSATASAGSGSRPVWWSSALAVALTFNVTDALQRAIPDYTASAEQGAEQDRQRRQGARHEQTGEPLTACAQEPVDGAGRTAATAPAIAGIQQWLNTPGDRPVTLGSLKGKVVLVDFWAYSCINCQRAIPHVEAWYSRLPGRRPRGHRRAHPGVRVRARAPATSQAGAKRLGITYPVALDNDYTTWNNFGNDSWPADYLIDSTGNVRHVCDRRGRLLRHRDADPAAADRGPPAASRCPRPPRWPTRRRPTRTQTPETYLGSERADSYAGATRSARGTSDLPPTPPPCADDEFALTGTWTVGDESLTVGPERRHQAELRRRRRLPRRRRHRHDHRHRRTARPRLPGLGRAGHLHRGATWPDSRAARSRSRSRPG